MAALGGLKLDVGSKEVSVLPLQLFCKSIVTPKPKSSLRKDTNPQVRGPSGWYILVMESRVCIQCCWFCPVPQYIPLGENVQV